MMDGQAQSRVGISRIGSKDEGKSADDESVDDDSAESVTFCRYQPFGASGRS
jgi:hypothetical protein